MERKKKFILSMTIMLLFVTVMATLTPKVAATTLTSLNPDHSPVGTTVRLIGEIENANATYYVYFYNGTAQVPVKIGTSTNLLVNTTFTVPSSIGGPQSVTLHDAAAGTNATLTFTVTSALCRIRTLNFDGELVTGVAVEAYNGTTKVENKPTDKNGAADFNLEAGNYTFKAFWKNGLAQVGTLDKTILTNDTLIEANLTVSLACIGIEVKDSIGVPIPLAGITFEYEYPTRENTTASGSDSFETDYNGITLAENMLVYIDYTIKASRFGHLFNTTLIENLTVSLWVNITVPNHSLFVTVLDSEGFPVQNVNVSVQEWSTWIPVSTPAVTNASGSAVFHITFGEYRVKVYNYSAELGVAVILNETIIDVIENQLLVIECKILNVDLSVKVIDLFGQPLPNAEIQIKREGIELHSSLKTTANGTVTLHNLIGGTYQIAIFIRGNLCENRTVNLQASSEEGFKAVKYIVIAGYPVGTGQFITLILLILLIIPLVIIFAYRKLKVKPVGKKTSEKA